ncbi:MAG TPA: sigma-70 family RNA polymerase sigma factor [Gaiellaceae bacterium]|nr:sigma-70 family RNA polymerase sigma factor [Gaiellaceae bacterium]
MTLAMRAAQVERERLIVRHLPLVDVIARRFERSGERREDLVQVGALALVRAVDRRDPARMAELTGYLARCVEGEIRRHLRDRAASVRLPRRVQQLDVRVRHARRELAATHGREPSPAELAGATGLRPAQLLSAAAAETARWPLELRDGDLAVDATTDDLALARCLVARAARVLDARERRIVLLRFFLDRSQAEIAAELGLSQAHVSRLLEGAMEKMRRDLEGAALCGTRRNATLGGDGRRRETGSDRPAGAADPRADRRG